MEEVKQFKKQNEVIYSTKELIGGLHIKMDKSNEKMDRIEKKLTKGQERFASIETSLRWHKRLILTLYAILGTLLLKPAGKFFKFIGGFL